jgi:RNA polymerase sigma-70 factor, ECF subfamily
MPDTPNTTELLARAAAADRSARDQLLTRHRTQLRRMVALRLDPRLAARLDPSDVVQDALAAADRRLDDFLRYRPLPFWLMDQDRATTRTSAYQRLMAPPDPN